MTTCPCGSGAELSVCCAPALDGSRPAATAEALMRSRYTAHTTGADAYLRKTHVPPRGSPSRTRGKGNAQTTWTKLEIVETEAGLPDDDAGVVEFRAHYRAASGEVGVHHERSRFRKSGSCWVYVDGDLVTPTTVKTTPKPGRNEPCSCGSGKKFKRCCGR